jgi:hypothetical protein
MLRGYEGHLFRFCATCQSDRESLKGRTGCSAEVCILSLYLVRVEHVLQAAAQSYGIPWHFVVIRPLLCLATTAN